MARYAERTSVPVEKSRHEIERILARYGAEQFMYGWDASGAMIAFVVSVGDQKRQIRFHLPLPSRDEHRFVYHSRGKRTPESAENEWEQACRQRWRALALVVKAKLEAVQSGIATFEDEFLAYIALPDGQTVGQWVGPQLEAAYDPDRGVMPSRLLPQLGRGDDDA